MLPSVTSNQSLDVLIYSIVSWTHPSSGHKEASKRDKSPNACEACILLGQKINNNKLMQFHISIKKIK